MTGILCNSNTKKSVFNVKGVYHERKDNYALSIFMSCNPAVFTVYHGRLQVDNAIISQGAGTGYSEFSGAN